MEDQAQDPQGLEDQVSEAEGSFTEKVLHAMNIIRERDRCSLIEAYTTYCEDHDLDVEDILEYLDKNAIQLLRQDAIEHNKVRHKIAQRESALPFE